MQPVTRDPVEQFYDEHVTRKLRDFVAGNARVDSAWHGIVTGAEAPRDVLEVGCGIGYVSARMKQQWPDAKVVALDVSPASIRLAEQLFGDAGVRFECVRLEELNFERQFDLVVLMDLYEHIDARDRSRFHAALARTLAPDAAIFLSFPTPEYQSYLRANEPEKLQPVDEDVSPSVLEELAADCGGALARYETVSVWRRLDYAHAWIRRDSGTPLRPVDPHEREKTVRRELVAERLGIGWLEAADRS